MVILINGSSHTGKTLLAQKLLEKYQYPYLSIDHLKMGLIRSGQTELTPSDDKELLPYLWNIVKEIVKTAIENEQNLIVEGFYIPFDWKDDFDENYLRHIKLLCLIMTEKYINAHFADIKHHADDIEKRLDDSWLNAEELISENKKNLESCKKYGCKYILINDEYKIDPQNL